MGREIKFRGKLINYCGQYHYDENNNYVMNTIGNWITGSLIDYGQSETQYKKGYYIFEDCKEFKVFDESVGQFTGIKDSNGKEIYEGDIVKMTHSDNYYLIKYEQGSYWLEKKGKGSREQQLISGFLISFDESSEIEVVGNMFDNPELLEEKE